MIGLAASPRIEVDPMCSIRRTAPPSARRIRARSRSNRAGHAGSHSTSVTGPGSRGPIRTRSRSASSSPGSTLTVSQPDRLPGHIRRSGGAPTTHRPGAAAELRRAAASAPSQQVTSRGLSRGRRPLARRATSSHDEGATAGPPARSPTRADVAAAASATTQRLWLRIVGLLAREGDPPRCTKFRPALDSGRWPASRLSDSAGGSEATTTGRWRRPVLPSSRRRAGRRACVSGLCLTFVRAQTVAPVVRSPCPRKGRPSKCREAILAAVGLRVRHVPRTSPVRTEEPGRDAGLFASSATRRAASVGGPRVTPPCSFRLAPALPLVSRRCQAIDGRRVGFG